MKIYKICFGVIFSLFVISGCKTTKNLANTKIIEFPNVENASLVDKKNTQVVNFSEQSQNEILFFDFSSATEAQKIIFSGKLNGGVKIKTSGTSPLFIELDNVEINSGNFPAIKITKASPVQIILKGKNVLNDGRKFGTNYKEIGDTSKATLISNGNLFLLGDGSLEINQNYKHAIFSKGFVFIKSGTYKISTQNGRDGIFAKTAFYMEDGNLTIEGNGSNTENQSRGIVVDGKESENPLGFVAIKGGNINIKTYSKGITAKWKNEDSKTENIDDNPDASVYIYGGKINIETSGKSFERTWQKQNFYDADGIEQTDYVNCAPEGIEGKNGVFIYDGDVQISATDDGINAGNAIEVHGGKVFARSSQGDGFDSNGQITISDGEVTTIAIMGSEDALDCGDTNSSYVAITGGKVVGISCGGMLRNEEFSETTQPTLIISAKSNFGKNNFRGFDDFNFDDRNRPEPPNFNDDRQMPPSPPLHFGEDDENEKKPFGKPSMNDDGFENRPFSSKKNVSKFLHFFEVESLSGKVFVTEKNGKELFEFKIPQDIKNASKIILSSPNFKNKKADNYKMVLEK